mmetsp:Transcript_51928/g.131261  ORF Transcript_51928/g.131261 Transcript_51928/m.131261 type:complete len:248 (+) Transcript_51928:628-1371(+)
MPVEPQSESFVLMRHNVPIGGGGRRPPPAVAPPPTPAGVVAVVARAKARAWEPMSFGTDRARGLAPGAGVRGGTLAWIKVFCTTQPPDNLSLPMLGDAPQKPTTLLRLLGVRSSKSSRLNGSSWQNRFLREDGVRRPPSSEIQPRLSRRCNGTFTGVLSGVTLGNGGSSPPLLLWLPRRRCSGVLLRLGVPHPLDEEGGLRGGCNPVAEPLAALEPSAVLSAESQPPAELPPGRGVGKKVNTAGSAS